jgi:hypothetical protein
MDGNEPQAKLLIGPGQVLGVGVAQVGRDVGASFDKVLDLLAGQGGPLAGGLA